MKLVKMFLLTGLILCMAFSLLACRRTGGQAATTIEVWSIQIDGDGPGTFQRAIDRFNRANPDIRVNLNLVANDVFKQRLAVAMAAGQTPDLFHSWSGGPMYEYANNNQILDITSYMNSNPAFRDKFLPASIAQASYNGRIWGVPMTNVAVCSVFYNREIFERLNLRIPATISELEALNDTLIRNGITPFSLANLTRWTGSMYFMFLATRHGGTQPFVGGVDGSGSFNNPSFIYAGEKIQEWVRKNYFLPGFNGLDWDSGQARAPLYRGETAMLLMGSWFVSQALSEDQAFFQRMGVFPFPRVDGGRGDPNTVIGTVGDNFYHISATSRNPDKAFELLTYLVDDQAVQDMLADGKIPPVRGVRIDNPMLRELFEQVNNAPDMQLWYDQSLSPEVADVHLRTSQELFGLTKTPQAAAQEMHEAQQAYLRSN